MLDAPERSFPALEYRENRSATDMHETMCCDGDDRARLYRAVSQDELDDILSFRGFRPGPGRMETKLFTISADDAAYFAREILYPLDNKPLTIVEVEVPHTIWNRLFHFTVDGKPVVAVDPSQLEGLNAAGRRHVLDSSPIP